jgi:cysteine desulfurase
VSDRAIYMDHHATTPVDERVLTSMLPYFREVFGNPASHQHAYGWAAERAVELARRQVADLIGARRVEIHFTSGATESDNLALKGIAEASAERGRHLITTVIEHRAVLDPCRLLEAQGYEVTYLPVSTEGLVDPEAVAAALRPDTILVSVMLARNEIGVIQPIEAIGARCRERGVPLHTDAAQAAGKLPIDVDRMGIDLLSLTAHKMYGPKGVGALYVRRRADLKLAAAMHGGGHERGLRSGTLNVPGIVGLGRACEISGEVLDEEARRVRELREHLHAQLAEALDEVLLNGAREPRLPGNLNVSFGGVDGDALLASLRGVAVSTTSACTSATSRRPYVLEAIGREPELARAALRFGLGRETTREEVDAVAEAVIRSVKRLRALGQ